MPDSTINNELRCSFADGFHVMDESELKRFFASIDKRWGIYDENRHMIISVSWTKPGLQNLMTNPKSVLNGTDAAMKQRLKEYKNTGSYELTIKEEKADGIRFEYKASNKDIMQYGEYVAFRRNKKFYIPNMLCHKEDADSCAKIFADFIESINF